MRSTSRSTRPSWAPLCVAFGTTHTDSRPFGSVRAEVVRGAFRARRRHVHVGAAGPQDHGRARGIDHRRVALHPPDPLRRVGRARTAAEARLERADERRVVHVGRARRAERRVEIGRAFRREELAHLVAARGRERRHRVGLAGERRAVAVEIEQAPHDVARARVVVRAVARADHVGEEPTVEPHRRAREHARDRDREAIGARERLRGEHGVAALGVADQEHLLRVVRRGRELHEGARRVEERVRLVLAAHPRLRRLVVAEALILGGDRHEARAREREVQRVRRRARRRARGGDAERAVRVEDGDVGRARRVGEQHERTGDRVGLLRRGVAPRAVADAHDRHAHLRRRAVVALLGEAPRDRGRVEVLDLLASHDVAARRLGPGRERIRAQADVGGVVVTRDRERTRRRGDRRARRASDDGSSGRRAAARGRDREGGRGEGRTTEALHHGAVLPDPARRVVADGFRWGRERPRNSTSPCSVKIAPRARSRVLRWALKG